MSETYDFTGEAIGPVSAEGGDGGLGPGGAGIDVRRVPHRETTRRWLAMALVGLFAIVVLLSLCSVVFDWAEVEPVKSMLEVLIPPLVALTGSVLGFYFGVERSGSS